MVVVGQVGSAGSMAGVVMGGDKGGGEGGGETLTVVKVRQNLNKTSLAQKNERTFDRKRPLFTFSVSTRLGTKLFAFPCALIPTHPLTH